MTETKQGNGGSISANEIEHLVASARDALTDDMVTRLSATVGDGLDLLDRVNRSGIARALPAITQLVENGDLDRLVGLARLVAALEDTLSDDIVKRLAFAATELVTLADKLARNEGLMKLVDLLGREEAQDALVNTAEAACAARTDAAALPAPKGGVAGLWQIARDPDTQEALRFLALVSGRLRKR
ncbi:MAG: helical membrane plugin domain-containing protein [Sulfuricaulis sp.]